MYQDEDRIEAIFQKLCEKLEEFRNGILQTNEFRIFERRAEFHESEERRAKKQLPIILNELKQREVYREINLKKTREKENVAAYIRAKQGF